MVRRASTYSQLAASHLHFGEVHEQRLPGRVGRGDRAQGSPDAVEQVVAQRLPGDAADGQASNLATRHGGKLRDAKGGSGSRVRNQHVAHTDRPASAGGRVGQQVRSRRGNDPEERPFDRGVKQIVRQHASRRQEFVDAVQAERGRTLAARRLVSYDSAPADTEPLSARLKDSLAPPVDVSSFVFPLMFHGATAWAIQIRGKVLPVYVGTQREALTILDYLLADRHADLLPPRYPHEQPALVA